jgi:hypothetical protein
VSDGAISRAGACSRPRSLPGVMVAILGSGEVPGFLQGTSGVGLGLSHLSAGLRAGFGVRMAKTERLKEGQ